MKQDDVKINGHSVEYRVYAEDPARKFLPSIGFLRKYHEPKFDQNIRIDTGVEEGSEISMYYDPMISKLITWGEDRQQALDLLDKSFDEYVIRGVTHNLGFGKSLIHEPGFKAGDYSTAFIPTFYPDGFSGDDLNSDDKHLIALSAFLTKHNHEKQNVLPGTQ